MRHRSLFGLMLALPLAIASFAAFALNSAVALARDMLAMFKPEPMRLAGDTYGLPMSITGHPIAAATQHSLRHEAGVSRFAAARNT
jgi:hypothetical protein